MGRKVIVLTTKIIQAPEFIYGEEERFVERYKAWFQQGVQIKSAGLLSIRIP